MKTLVAAFAALILSLTLAPSADAIGRPVPDRKVASQLCGKPVLNVKRICRPDHAPVLTSSVIDLTRACGRPLDLNCSWYGAPYRKDADVLWTNLRRPDGAVYCQIRRVGPQAGTRCETYWPFV